MSIFTLVYAEADFRGNVPEYLKEQYRKETEQYRDAAKRLVNIFEAALTDEDGNLGWTDEAALAYDKIYDLRKSFASWHFKYSHGSPAYLPLTQEEYETLFDAETKTVNESARMQCIENDIFATYGYR